MSASSADFCFPCFPCLPWFLIAVCVAASPGCGNKATFATIYSYEVRCEGATKATGVGAQPIHANCAGNRLDITDGQLQVNGRIYGKLKDKDAVLVDASGQVFVNKVKRVAE